MGRKRLVSDEQLLEAARAAFVERGLAASTKEIARRAGVSEAVLFQRYETKAELFFAAMVPPNFDIRACAPSPSSDESGRRIIRDLFFGLLDYFRVAAPVVTQLLANHAFEFEKFAEQHPENTLVTLRWSLVGFLEELRRAQKVDADPRWAALALFTMAHSLAVFERLGAHGGRFSEAMIEATIETLWDGFKPKATAMGG